VKGIADHSISENPELGDAMKAAEIEVANRAEATALLVRCGYRIYRPEADIAGEDLLLRSPKGGFRAVQLKGRMLVHSKYGGIRLWMLFPDRPWQPLTNRTWYLVPHDKLYDYLKSRHGRAKGWKDAWSKRNVPEADQPFLKKFIVRIPKVAKSR
jgi:hypothetical protein